MTLEQLYTAIPADHSIKKSDTALHLKTARNEDRGAGDADRPPQGSNHKKPKLPEFDGKTSSWLWWKTIFEREVKLSANIPDEHKFSYLLSSLKRNTFASKIVLNYVGVGGAFSLAWKDLSDHFASTCDIKTSHLQASRDLSKNHQVLKVENFRRLEDLHQAAWGRVNALKALEADPALYKPLAVMGLAEALPDVLRVKFLLDNKVKDLDESHFDALFDFLRGEIDARRRSWSMSPGKYKTQTREKEKLESRKPETKDRFQHKNKYQKGKSPKESSMLQVSPQEDPSDDLN